MSHRISLTVEEKAQLDEAQAKFIRLANEAIAHREKYYPEGLMSMAEHHMIYCDAKTAEAELFALRAKLGVRRR
jgi:hypothetical protein